VIDEVGDLLSLKYSRRDEVVPFSENDTVFRSRYINCIMLCSLKYTNLLVRRTTYLKYCVILVPNSAFSKPLQT